MQIKNIKSNAFLMVGMLGICAALSTTQPEVQNFVDSTSYKIAENTVFKPVEEFRLNIIEKGIRDAKLILFFDKFENDYDVTAYKQQLKNKDFFNKEIEAIKGLDADFKELEKKPTPQDGLQPVVFTPPSWEDLPKTSDATIKVEPVPETIPAYEAEIKEPKIVMTSIQDMRKKFNEAMEPIDLDIKFDFSDIPNEVGKQAQPKKPKLK